MVDLECGLDLNTLKNLFIISAPKCECIESDGYTDHCTEEKPDCWVECNGACEDEKEGDDHAGYLRDSKILFKYCKYFLQV